MGAEKEHREAERWLRTAEGDLRTARVLRDASRYAHACFHAHQAAEKSLKACAFARSGDPWGHSVQDLIRELATADPALGARLLPLAENGARLDRYYIPTRYPNGLPQETPEEAFFESDAVQALAIAEDILSVARHLTP
jgi:HEPN domain-containing protein